MASALDCECELALLLCSEACVPPRDDAASVGEVPVKQRPETWASGWNIRSMVSTTTRSRWWWFVRWRCGEQATCALK
jgi:hypothetical protein